MEQKRKALGKGLEQLFNNEAFDINELEKTIIESSDSEDVIEVSLNELRKNPYQPRKIFDDAKLEELAESIKTYGVIEPIIVKKSIKGYEIIAGERRVLASKKLGLKTIPAIVREFTDNEMMEIAILENIQREDLSVIEEAVAYKTMIDKLDLTQEEVARRMGKSRSHITNIIGLLRLPKKVQIMVLEGKLSMGHARILSKLEDEEKIEGLAESVIKEDLSVRSLESIVTSPVYKRKEPIKKSTKEKNYKHIENILREKIGTLVRINNKNIVIPYDSEKDLERILEIINIDINVE